MKKIIFAIYMLCTMGAFAANEESVTSREYVDAGLAATQDSITTTGTGVMTYDSAQDSGIGQKQIYDSTGDYTTQQDALVTASTANAAVQNAIAAEFECIEWDPNDNTKCWLVQIKSKLMDGYTALEYLESDGTQYIDTGLPVKSNTLAEFEYQFTDTNVNYVFGQVAGNGTSAMGYRRMNVGSWWFVRTQIDIADTLKHHVVFGNDGNLYRDNTIIATRGTYGTDQSHTIIIFGERNDSGVLNKGRVKIYYITFREGDNIVRNFIPARRNSDGELGMYDTVSRTFFTNDGTESFIAGPVKNAYLPTGNQ